MKTRYDDATKTLWIATDIDSDTLVPNQEMQTWAKALREGSTPEGKPLTAVNYVFSDEGAAEYNQHSLAFSRLGTYVGTLSAPVAYGDAPAFETKDDFGV